MKFIKQDLLTLLISLFILSACNNPDSVGLEVDPDYAINGKLIDTSTIHTVTVLEDSMSTGGLSKYPLGYMIDPVFGTTEANVALSLSVPNSNFGFGNAPALDSAVLVLDYAGNSANAFYGDSTNSVYQINVHQLQEEVTSSVNNTKQFSFSPQAIGTRNVRVSLRDSVKVRAIVPGKADADSTYAPQVRIPISSAFIQANLLNADSTNFADNTKLRALIKGLYLTVNKTNSTGPGGVMFFDLTTAGVSKLEVYYKNTNGTTIDTNVVRFGIQSGTAPVAATFKHNYAGTPVEAQLNSTSQNFTTTYVQGLAGLKTRVRFPYLTNLKSLGNVVINKAELVIEVAEPVTPFAPVPRLFLYRTDIAGQKQQFPELDDFDFRSIPEGAFGGGYDASKKRYIFSVTSYVQDIINGRMKQFDAFIAPTDLTSSKQSALFPTGTVAARSILGGFGNPTVKMKLNIIYTAAGQ